MSLIMTANWCCVRGTRGSQSRIWRWRIFPAVHTVSYIVVTSTTPLHVATESKWQYQAFGKRKGYWEMRLYFGIADRAYMLWRHHNWLVVHRRAFVSERRDKHRQKCGRNQLHACSCPCFDGAPMRCIRLHVVSLAPWVQSLHDIPQAYAYLLVAIHWKGRQKNGQRRRYGVSSHESASHFGLANVLYAKTPTDYRENQVPCNFFCQLNEPASDPSKRGGDAGHVRSIASELILAHAFVVKMITIVGPYVWCVWNIQCRVYDIDIWPRLILIIINIKYWLLSLSLRAWWVWNIGYEFCIIMFQTHHTHEWFYPQRVPG